MTLQKRSYTSGHFELMIDGHQSTAYLKSVDGGHVKANAIDEPIGPHNQRIKHTSTVEIEPFSIDFGISGAKDIMRWVQMAFNKEISRRSGMITHANFDLRATFEHEFYDALLTEVTFPALDGSSKESAYMKMKIQPERVIPRKISNGAPLKGGGGTKQKLWNSSNFRFNIDGLDEMRYTNKIESFTVKQGIKKYYTGEDRFPQLEPTNLQFPHIVGTISLEYADKLLKWHQDYIMKGTRDDRAEKTGSIEFLAPDMKTTLFQINLFEMGIHALQIQQSQANQDSIKRVKFDLYVGRMQLDGGGSLGME